MSFLTLKDIGKIYVSEGNVSVGIRGVNLSFEKGEFVAITGKSGSGKSTLLNVISGMDTYEEGELFIEGSPTSHYLQKDWEKYREKYISFIFQDYNIIDSFTVLQNVELALMNIEDLKERRRRATELIKRVGLEKQIRHKGSKLSGGQKQRTVIARALAKDSPIILADEPTGNLDTKSSEEIINLLREVSKDKLVIVVTHNFEQFEHCSTRHIRVFDGAIETDHVIDPSAAIPSENGAETAEIKPITGTKNRKLTSEQIKHNLKNGLQLGKAIFTAKPRLSFFMCLLLIVGTLGIFLVTSFLSGEITLFDKRYMFNDIPGRVIVTKLTGEPITDAEISDYAAKTGASDTLHYDFLLDDVISSEFSQIPLDAPVSSTLPFYVSYKSKPSGKIIGRMPQKEGECLLYLPITVKPYFGSNSFDIKRVDFGFITLDVCGISYFIDNRIPQAIVTEETFKVITCAKYIYDSENFSATLKLLTEDGNDRSISSNVFTSYRLEKNAFCPIYIYSQPAVNFKYKQLNIEFTVGYSAVNYSQKQSKVDDTYEKTYENVTSAGLIAENTEEYNALYVGTDIIKDLAENALVKSYRQLSLFYPDNATAAKAAKTLRSMGLIAVTSKATYSPEMYDMIGELVMTVIYGILWILIVVFLAFFINLCTMRAVGAFKPDMAIMRSMGIETSVIRVGVYVRMLISAIPAIIAVIAAGIIIFNSPKLNSYFTYLEPWKYLLVIAGTLCITLMITRKQIKKLFKESVKSTIRGGDAA